MRRIAKIVIAVKRVNSILLYDVTAYFKGRKRGGSYNLSINEVPESVRRWLRGIKKELIDYLEAIEREGT